MLKKIFLIGCTIIAVGCDHAQNSESDQTVKSFTLHKRRLIEYEVNRDSIWLAIDSTVYEDSNGSSFGSSPFNCSFNSVGVKGDSLFVQASNHIYDPSKDWECLDSTYDVFSHSTNK